jgi:hypothetical protein
VAILLYSVQTRAENAFQDLNGKDVWQFRSDHPELRRNIRPR